MEAQQKKPEITFKGGVIVIGSLFWEDETNCLKKDIKKGELRKEWRKNLQLSKKEIIPLPVRYGRYSCSKNHTYTMVLSKEFLNGEGRGLAIPYEKEFNSDDFEKFKEQVQFLAKAEGISKDGDIKYATDWGAVSIWIKPTLNEESKIREWWNQIIIHANGYKNHSNDFDWKGELMGKLIDDKYILCEEVKIDTEFKYDFLLLTYIKPKHKDISKNNEQVYPTTKEIANEMLSSGYQTYFCQNRASQIVTGQDTDIISYLSGNKI